MENIHKSRLMPELTELWPARKVCNNFGFKRSSRHSESPNGSFDNVAFSIAIRLT